MTHGALCDATDCISAKCQIMAAGFQKWSSLGECECSIIIWCMHNSFNCKPQCISFTCESFWTYFLNTEYENHEKSRQIWSRWGFSPWQGCTSTASTETPGKTDALPDRRGPFCLIKGWTVSLIKVSIFLFSFPFTIFYLTVIPKCVTYIYIKWGKIR